MASPLCAGIESRGGHGNVKHHLRNDTPGSINQLRAQVDRVLARLRSMRTCVSVSSDMQGLMSANFGEAH
jgi:hypothetical protein